CGGARRLAPGLEGPGSIISRPRPKATPSPTAGDVEEPRPAARGGGPACSYGRDGRREAAARPRAEGFVVDRERVARPWGREGPKVLATDLATVGRPASGILQPLLITAGAWAVVAASASLQHAKVAGVIAESLRWAGVSPVTVTVAIDEDEGCVRLQSRAVGRVPHLGVPLFVDVAKHPPRTHPGVLFQRKREEELL
uniref:hypothetical protein n=1 Tax=Paludisphaera soli TaxID=2712865 RepID=UPI001980647D